MCPIDDLNNDERTALMRVAVIEHYRTWLHFDGVELARITQGGDHPEQDPVRSLDQHAVRRIAKEYNVNRGIFVPEENENDDVHAAAVAQDVNGAVEGWPENLIERATRCEELTNNANENGHTNGRQASAFSKLIWFLRPEGWTPFDRFTADALGIIPRNDNVARMTNYYEELDNRGFNDCAQQITAYLHEHEYPELFGERVIDKFLMLIGAGDEWAEDVIQRCNYFPDLLPGQAGEALNEIATLIGWECGPMTLPNNQNNA